jgi:flagellar motor switch protein FliG
MSANAQVKPTMSIPSLSGAEKVAVLLLALGKPRAAKLLKRFEPEQLRLLTRLSGDLRPITAADLETLVEEFALKFSSGVNFVGTEKEVRNLLSGAMTEDQMAEAMSSEHEVAPVNDQRVWEKISTLKEDALRGFLNKEHPQTVALILSRIESAMAAKIIASFAADVRNDLLCRMLGIGQISDDVVRAVEVALSEDLLAPTSSASHTGIADILNRLDKSQSEDVLKSLAEVRPDDAKALKQLLFTFEDLVTLQPKARTLVFDQVPIERLVIALKGTDTAFQSTILSSLASRSRRMVEAELQGGASSSQREIADARRAIVDTVLKMIGKGEIELQAADALEDVTA